MTIRDIKNLQLEGYTVNKYKYTYQTKGDDWLPFCMANNNLHYTITINKLPQQVKVLITLNRNNMDVRLFRDAILDGCSRTPPNGILVEDNHSRPCDIYYKFYDANQSPEDLQKKINADFKSLMAEAWIIVSKRSS